MRSELRDLVKELNLTILSVSHEQIEALTMPDRIGVMKDGAIVQEGTPAEIYGKPTHPFVADVIGKTNFVKGRATVSERDTDGLITVDTAVGHLQNRIADKRMTGGPFFRYIANECANRPVTETAVSPSRP